MTFLSKNLPTLVISAITIRILICGAGIGDAIAVLGAIGLIAYEKFLGNVANPTDEMQKELDKIKGDITNLSMTATRKPQQPLKF